MKPLSDRLADLASALDQSGKAPCILPANAPETLRAASNMARAEPWLRKALGDILQTFEARPDMMHLCGPHEMAQLVAAKETLDQTTT